MRTEPNPNPDGSGTATLDRRDVPTVQIPQATSNERNPSPQSVFNVSNYTCRWQRSVNDLFRKSSSHGPRLISKNAARDKQSVEGIGSILRSVCMYLASLSFSAYIFRAFAGWAF
jgi:hypothetical protein